MDLQQEENPKKSVGVFANSHDWQRPGENMDSYKEKIGIITSLFLCK